MINAKLLKELGDRVISGKNLCPDNQTTATTPRHKRTYTSPYDNDQWGRCWHSQLTLGDGKIIW
jgi:hypothetical protein